MSTTETEYILSTEQFAAMNMVKAQSVRARVSRFGSYFGINPVKLANGRTVWPKSLVRATDVAIDAR